MHHGRAAVPGLGENALENRHPLRQLLTSRHQWRQQSHGVLASGAHQKTVLERSADDLRCGHGDIDPPHVSHPSHGAHSAGTGCDGAKLLTEPRAALAYTGEERRIAHTLQYVQRDARDQWPTPEGRRVIARSNGGRDLLVEEHRSHRESAGKGLRQRKQVRVDTVALVREEVAGTTEPALHLIEDERDPPCSRHVAERAEKVAVEHPYAALALHRLDDQSGHRLGVERDVEGAQIALDDSHTASERPERRAVRWAIRRRQRCEETAVKAPSEGHDLVLPRAAVSQRPASGELERTLIRSEEHTSELQSRLH